MHTLRRITIALAAACLSACQVAPLNQLISDVFSSDPAPSVKADAGADKAAAERTPMAKATSDLLVPSLPLVERRESLSATGYAVISVQNHRTPAQQRLLAIRAAKLDAYRSLAEQVYGLRLDATTTVADMVVQNDTFRSKVEGVIYGATLVSITPSGDDTYETTLSLDKNTVQDLRMLYLTQLASRSR
ncbi:MAG: LPP20 family lipoprotein [Betaproteobacteria bacterium]